MPPQTPEEIEQYVRAFVEKEFAALKTKTKMALEVMSNGEAWVTDYKHWNYEAAKRATYVRLRSQSHWLSSLSH